jgi:hypothetical protein
MTLATLSADNIVPLIEDFRRPLLVRMIAHAHPHAVDPARTTRPTLFESWHGLDDARR